MNLRQESMLKAESLSDKVIWVTGGGTGLGKSMVKSFINLGARVAISGRRLEKLEEAQKEISTDRILPVVCDVRESGQVESALSQIVDHFGICNGLVNNAAGNFISPTDV